MVARVRGFDAGEGVAGTIALQALTDAFEETHDGSVVCSDWI